MGQIIPIRPTGALTRRDPRRVALFSRTAGKELRGAEVDEALEWCEIYGANPFVRDIYFFVFDADKPDKRRVVPVLGIGLYRKIAARTGNYRPDEAPPRFVYSEAAVGPLNPKGLVSAEVSVNVHSHGAWHKVTSCLKWEERAPIREIWAENDHGKRRPTGTFELDPKKTNWATMPETMLAKCTEADAIRKAWPNETSGSYLAEELDAAQTIEATATEIVDGYERQQRLSAVGATNALMVQWDDNGPIVSVPVGKFGDAALTHIRNNAGEPLTIQLWATRNREVLRTYWAHDKAGALAVKKALEAAKAATS